MRPAAVVLAVVASQLVVAIAMAQGVLVVVDPSREVRLPRPIASPRPQPPGQYAIDEIDMRVRLADQVARVQVSQTFVNTGSTQLEVAFVFPLPYDGAIDQLTLLVDGQEFAAQLLPADEARRRYEEIVRKNRDPALLEWIGTGMFQTSVFPVPPGASRTVSLRYTQLCRHDRGLTDLLLPLSTARYTSRAIEKLNIEVSIESQQPIKNIYSPSHGVDIDRHGQRSATVRYSAKQLVPRNDFRLLYDTGDRAVEAQVLSYRPRGEEEDGYLLLLVAPEIMAGDEQRQPKTVIFVVDRSGSMSGEKFEQAQEALRFVLNNLRQGDLFNIIAYDSEIESFRPELERFDEQSRQAALGFVNGLYSGGSTNIDGALQTALGQLQDSDRPSYVLFLTDGLPTAGETNELKIVDRASSSNRVRARVFAFGVGYDVNSRLLDKLVRANFGQSQYVRPDEDIEDRVSRLYRSIESPVLTDVQITFEIDAEADENEATVNRLYPRQNYDLFEGEQLAVVGRYQQAGPIRVRISGSLGGQVQSFTFDAELVDMSRDDNYGFVEKLWALRRVGEIIDELDLKGENQELITELVELSTKHGILTPYTSFLADETVDLRAVDQNAAAAGSRLEDLSATQGRAAFLQRAEKARLQTSTRGLSEDQTVLALDGEGAGEVRESVTTVQNVGQKAFYWRDGRWVESTVTADDEAAAQRVVQFSDEYFELAGQYGRQLSQYLVFDEPVLVTVAGQAYLIEPPAD